MVYKVFGELPFTATYPNLIVISPAHWMYLYAVFVYAYLKPVNTLKCKYVESSTFKIA